MGELIVLEFLHPKNGIKVSNTTSLDNEVSRARRTENTGHFVHLDFCGHIPGNKSVLAGLDGDLGVDLETDQGDHPGNQENGYWIFRNLYRNIGKELAVRPRTLFLYAFIFDFLSL